MIFNLNNNYEHQKFKDYVNKLFVQKAIIEVKKKPLNRSLSQNNYLHLILSYFASQYGCSSNEAKVDFYKRLCNKELFQRKTINKLGNEVSFLRSSSQLTTLEMTTSIERFRNWSSGEAGIYLPAPNEHQMILYVQQEIERSKDFI